MGVSIYMTPGPVGRNFGKQTDITPGWRSVAAGIIESRFGSAPLTLTRDQDLDTLRTLQEGASVYAGGDDNVWKRIADALDEHGALTITMQW